MASLQRRNTIVNNGLQGFVLQPPCIGRGAFAEVYRAINENTKQVVAIKRFTRQTLSRVATETLISEIALLKRLRHQHIVTLFDHQWDDKYVYLIMEYCAGGDLAVFLRRKGTLPELEAQLCLRQLASGMRFLWEHSLIHRDLKPANILLLHQEDSSHLKIADFGFAEKNVDGSSTAKLGTPLYMAPEILRNNSYDAKVDLWSLGVIFYEMLFGQTPFQSRTKEDLLRKLTADTPVNIPDRSDVSDEAKTLLSLLLLRDPMERIGFEEFFSSVYLDLDYLAGPESLDRARALLQDAVRADEQGNVATAIQLYQQGVAYLNAAFKYETDANKAQSLQKKSVEYASRLEVLKKSLEATSSSRKHPTMSRAVSNGDANSITLATRLIERAQKAEQDGDANEAMHLYQRSVGHFMAAIKGETNEQQKNELRSQCLRILDRAEALQQQLKSTQKIVSTQPQIVTYAPPENDFNPTPTLPEQPAPAQEQNYCIIQ